MNVEDVKKLIAQITETVQDDTDLDPDLRNEILELTYEVVSDPTPDNVSALALVLKKIAQMEKYVGALEVLLDPTE